MIKKQIPWTAADIPSQAGRCALVTGANSGIGFHTALELARHGKANSPIISTAAHPGYSVTNLQADHMPLSVKLLSAVMKPFAQNAAGGALPTLFAATAPAARPGGFYGPDGFISLKGAPVPAEVPARASDGAVAQRLWTESERLTRLDFPMLEMAA